MFTLKRWNVFNELPVWCSVAPSFTCLHLSSAPFLSISDCSARSIAFSLSSFSICIFFLMASMFLQCLWAKQKENCTQLSGQTQATVRDRRTGGSLWSCSREQERMAWQQYEPTHSSFSPTLDPYDSLTMFRHWKLCRLSDVCVQYVRINQDYPRPLGHQQR